MVISPQQNGKRVIAKCGNALQAEVKAGIAHSMCAWQVKLCDTSLRCATPKHSTDEYRIIMHHTNLQV